MTVVVLRRGDLLVGTFTAMGGPCEVLFENCNEASARRLCDLAAAEVLRIERKFSRYRDDSAVGAINAAGGAPVRIDDETARLLDLAAQCHALSGGRFDVTSGILRRVWKFDGSDRLPSRGRVKALLPLIGWEKVAWHNPVITLPAGMEIDLGGLGKEYAADRAADLLAAAAPAAALVNLGGDLRATGPRSDGAAWRVGVEDPGREDHAERILEMKTGGLATSGDARRYLLRGGVRYGHLLNPRTGWPVRDAPRAVTVAAPTCTEAGVLATLAMLHGRDAEAFLDGQGVTWWCHR
ncbi:MAG: FAD:protein FMN transferase [bacterium]|nr:FAD:protein FMN transferase [bacterium]